MADEEALSDVKDIIIQKKKNLTNTFFFFSLTKIQK